jgi:ER degradation enhancer, mannosidase alpha-like 2
MRVSGITDAMPTRTIALLLLLALGAVPAAAAPRQARHGKRPARPDTSALADRVREEFLHAWRGYERYAWGHDDLRPLTKTHHDWYGDSLLMTPVDALDTMLLMGLDAEAAKTRELVATTLSFDKDIYVKNFEITIRLLGGLLSAYEMTGDRRLLALADDLGTRLLPAFESPTGIPYMYVNLKTGKVRNNVTNPAEAGTLLVEFGTLSRLTRKPVYYEKAKRALVEVFKRRSKIGLVGQRIDVETGAWTVTNSHVGAEIDSYYEYLLKCSILFGDRDCHRMWLASIGAVNRYLADERGGLWYGHADMATGRRTATIYGALDAFLPAVLALGGDLGRAKRLQASCYRMWTLHGVEPEELDYATMTVKDGAYHLRPEIVESTYYLYHYTRDPRYLDMGRTFFEDFVKACRTEAGYAALKDVRTGEKLDVMHSFLFAETFKYYYLLFSPPETLRFDSVVFNTEAHPMKRGFPLVRRG